MNITPAEVRAELLDEVLKHLVGPGEGEHEILKPDPRHRYYLGILAPQERQVDNDPEEEVQSPPDDDFETSTLAQDDDAIAELPVGRAVPMFEPASFGLSFSVLHDPEQPAVLQVKARYGIYRKVKEDAGDVGKARYVWQHRPIEALTEPFTLRKCHQETIALRHNTLNAHKGCEQVYLRVSMRRHEGCWIVTLFLLNDQRPQKRNKSEAYLFQAELQVQARDQRPVFLKRLSPHAQAGLNALDRSEKQTMHMLYRKQVEFAVGHGIAVHATLAPKEVAPHCDKAIALSTRVAPQYELPNTLHTVWGQHPETIEQNIFPEQPLSVDMKQLAEFESADLLLHLRPLTVAYRNWCNRLQARLEQTPERFARYGDAAQVSIERCHEACSRIEAGIELLANDAQARQAFQAANRAMYLQRLHTQIGQARRKGQEPDLEEIDRPERRSWRLFQLAFMLLNLPGITQLDHPERQDDPAALADLLWFPTGGGKTEAYLGLTAYTLFLRRLQGTIVGRQGESGVAVLMRYTLRLLTLQQFQRATTLICACEEMRCQEPEIWGQTPFRIGLWVGDKTTPNTTASSMKYVDALNGTYQEQQEVSGKGNPLQLGDCPWCGHELDPVQALRVEGEFPSQRGRTLLYCGNMSCEFSERSRPDEGLPVVTVDEEIYRLLPALVIATVDKFAQMPWKGQVQTLFGQVNGFCPRHGFRAPEIYDADRHNAAGNLPAVRTEEISPLRPPDLIIQDEFHLISGPLGSMVGLYETAVDALCSWQFNGQTVRPKVILSTATIRRAEVQVREVFNRQVCVFPPNGLDIEDNFFSTQVAPTQDAPGRLYVGLCAPGRKIKELQIAVYAYALAAAQAQFNYYGNIADPWMTLVGYFNTTRELGGTVSLLRDDIQTMLRTLPDRGLAKRLLREDQQVELTSRVNADQIKKILKQIEVPFDLKTQKKRQEIIDAFKKDNPKGKASKTAFKAFREALNQYPLAIDALLATNMISVGVDIDRLGLMIVTRQPKTTAEYIQATSRVGRAKGAPGLVMTLYNWAHPRDLSHYEVFEHYHATFYQHVEANSVTAFSSRALDRGLSALLVALIRLSDMQFNANTEAAQLPEHDAFLEKIIDTIAQRATQVRQDEKMQSRIKTELQSRLDFWRKRILQLRQDQKQLGYDTRSGNIEGLLRNPESLEQSTGQMTSWELFTCLNSLRNVEPQVSLVMPHNPKERGTRPPLRAFVKSENKKQGAKK